MLLAFLVPMWLLGLITDGAHGAAVLTCATAFAMAVPLAVFAASHPHARLDVPVDRLGQFAISTGSSVSPYVTPAMRRIRRRRRAQASTTHERRRSDALPPGRKP